VSAWTLNWSPTRSEPARIERSSVALHSLRRVVVPFGLPSPATEVHRDTTQLVRQPLGAGTFTQNVWRRTTFDRRSPTRTERRIGICGRHVGVDVDSSRLKILGPRAWSLR
jgi:hypothetical protein